MLAPSHPPPNATNEDCAECARLRNCQPCFEELLRRFQSPILHFFIQRVRSRHDAEDLLQETFLLAYRNLRQYRPTWQFSTWLFTIANRQAISKWRKRKSSAPTQNHHDQRAGGIDPLQHAIGNEQSENLWTAAGNILNPDAFTALWLSYVESMPAAQIGHVLGRNANAVRILLHRARAQLSLHLQPTDDVKGIQ